ncbi:DUF4250 domain-containing protein [Bariatricus massiliensis]|uniref:DUF4250 domain-containing protein n=1 Tax=Bariatricus massiliensis TaxID=1745713 RepID=A0ABS8DCP7_9FIRM|nr:DUF4250 domain-containing protein [Bariatricus massiliensis]MCB7303393.1 DUF4250 domain-containing protein [Bariatricus massiliensis]MCB7373525.1 DUF4250 domain-containing protein [Bariatricus massiliensis]MCB7386195.1 DUF4250 domain-containing protein [Bariatricus massiliensis]MCB7410357.1 DUF4250 domain-containing protein [Bariatricus massiliensis]MCQ5252359.1 DUF4250 domain-containing protein [Bariatricus massiliensis]
MRKQTVFNELPNDPVLLLSVINTKLRDYYADLDALCDDLQIDRELLTEKLGSIDYEYEEKRNQFV